MPEKESLLFLAKLKFCMKSWQWLLLGYVHFVHIEVLHEELAMALSLQVDTWGETVIALMNVTACATDSAPSMMGRYSGFMAFPKAASSNVLTIYCDIHLGHLIVSTLFRGAQ